MAPCRVFKYYKNIYCSKNLTENPEKFWVEYSNRLVGLRQVASLTKSGQEPALRQYLHQVTHIFGKTDKEVVMVVDRSGIHRAKKLASTLAHYEGQLQLHLLPAHCGHHLNPIE